MVYIILLLVKIYSLNKYDGCEECHILISSANDKITIE